MLVSQRFKKKNNRRPLKASISARQATAWRLRMMMVFGIIYRIIRIELSCNKLIKNLIFCIKATWTMVVLCLL